jgi:hypothetical protein
MPKAPRVVKPLQIVKDAAKKTKQTTSKIVSGSEKKKAAKLDNVPSNLIPSCRLQSSSVGGMWGPLRFLSWNVNGLRALLKKESTLRDLVAVENPDVVCLQETKVGRLYKFERSK